MAFNPEKLKAFCASLVIDSKEDGRVRLRWNGCQREYVKRVAAGLESGRHRFVVLKARQLGLTTVSLAVDLYWAFLHPGLKGAIAVNNESTRENCRSIIAGYQRSLLPRWKVPVEASNRNEIRYANASRLAFLIAGGRNSGQMGRSQGLNFLHATEVSSWSDPEGVLSLDASLAQSNKDRLYVYESTARGYNVFQEMWTDAKRSQTTEAIFIGWWMKEQYRISEHDKLFATYGHHGLNADERKWARDVERLYGATLDQEQWAWWRWMWEERGGSKLLFAEFPFTEEQAFVMTGDAFFPGDRIAAGLQRSLQRERTEWAYQIGTNFEDTELEPVEGGPLSIWEEPVEGCDYVVAGDPAFGSSDWGDCFCAQVLKCTPRGVEQVAEFNTPDIATYQFAWILAHLCGAYSSPNHAATLIVELGGGGVGVFDELKRIPQQYDGAGAREKRGGHAIQNVLGSIQHYLYVRPDTFSGSPLPQWMTTGKTKQLMMNVLRDMIVRGDLKANSPEFYDEAKYIAQDGVRIQAEGHRKDDRVMAMALACVAYHQQVKPNLVEPEALENPSAAERSVQNFLARVQSAEADRRYLAEEQARWLE